MIIGFGNNVASALASDITATQTSFSVMPGSGSKFANLLTTDISNPDSPHGIYAKLTLTDSQQTVFEICHLLSVSQDTLTVLRGQEGTQAKGWSLNDVVANFATRGSEHHFVQIDQLQAGDYTAAKAGGTANALAIMLPSTFFNNSSTDWQLNTPLIITPTVTNTGAATLQVTISGKVVGTYPLVKGNNTALQAGDIVDKSPFVTVFNAEQERFIILNPTTEIGVVRTVNSIGPDSSGNVAIPMYGLGLGPVAKSDAYSKIAQFYRINNVSANKPPAVTGNVSAGVVCLPMDAAPSAGYFSVVGGSVAAYAGFSGAEAGGITWARIYTDKFKPTAADIDAVARTGDRMSGTLGTTYADSYRIVAGKYGTFWRNDGNNFYLMLTKADDQWGGFNDLRPLTVNNATGSMTLGTPLNFDNQDYVRKTGINSYQSGGNNFNQTNGYILQGAGDQYAQSYFLETVGQYTALRWRVRGGNADGWPEFRNDGSLYLAGSFPCVKNSAGTTWHPDGNIESNMWGGYLSNWLNNQFTARDNNINTRATWDYVNNTFGAKNTANFSGNGWWRCGSTGMIIQWGTVGQGNDLPVNFPITFPNFCLSVQMTQSSSHFGSQSTSNISATGRDRTGFTSHIYSQEISADWIAVGF